MVGFGIDGLLHELRLHAVYGRIRQSVEID